MTQQRALCIFIRVLRTVVNEAVDVMWCEGGLSWHQLLTSGSLALHSLLWALGSSQGTSILPSPTSFWKVSTYAICLLLCLPMPLLVSTPNISGEDNNKDDLHVQRVNQQYVIHSVPWWMDKIVTQMVHGSTVYCSQCSCTLHTVVVCAVISGEWTRWY